MEMRKQYQKTLRELLETNEKVVMLDADLVSASGTKENFEAFPKRCINVGISEANMISAAAGMLRTGLIPYVHTFAPFATRRVLDQLFMSGVYSQNRMHIYGSDPGYWAQHNGGTHTTYEDIAMTVCLPEIVVLAPCDIVQFDWILKEFLYHNKVFYTRATRKALPSLYEPDTQFELGKVITHGQGKDAIVFAIGDMVHEALIAQQRLKEANINITVVDCFSLKPFDSKGVIKLIQSSNCIITAENHNQYGGLGSLVSKVIAENKLSPKFKMIAINEQFGEVGTADYLKEKHGLTADNIINTVKE